MFQQRITKLKNILKEQRVDALLVSNFYNILYLTGFKTLTENEREAFVVVSNLNIYLITDGRYLNNIKNQKLNIKNIYKKSNIKILLMTPKKKLIQNLQVIVNEEKIIRFAVESEDIRLPEYLNIKEKLKVEIVPIDRLIVHLRMIKDSLEIRNIKEACRIGDQCLKEIIKTIKVGQTEKEIAWKIESWIRNKGYEIAFDPIVAIDKNSAIPHYNTKAGIGRVRHGSTILIDFGVRYQDYCPDMTRMIFIDKPNQIMINIYNILLSAQEKTIKCLHTIKYLKEADDFCRSLLARSRLAKLYYPHSSGHGVGLEVHEYPKVSMSSQDVIKPNQVFTIEPGIYFEGEWGMRIEDTVFVNKDLQSYVLTNFPKSLLIL